MDNEALIRNFKAICNEVYKFSVDEKSIIFRLIDSLSCLSSINNTDEEKKILCKKVYNILCDHDLWNVFTRILKNEKVYGYFRLIVTDGQYLV